MGILGILIAALIMLLLGFILSSILAIANRKLYVYEDPRIDLIEDILPSANCGACGLPGCRNFAESVVKGVITPADCTVSSSEDREQIAELLGVDAGNNQKKVARLACHGGTNTARQRARYEGIKSCRAASLVAGGGKGCVWGCLGLEDCYVACDFDAITMDQNSLPVVDIDKCTSCGDCVDACPQNLFSIQPINHHLWVACSNLSSADLAENECKVACTACNRCVLDADSELLEMTLNLPRVNYQYNQLASQRIIERCPTGAIVWFDKDNRMKKGGAAKKIIRNSPLPIG